MGRYGELNAGEEHPCATSIGGYTFKRPELLELALTHASYRNEHTDVPGDNERLEFLGDSVIHAIVAHMVYEACPEATEGFLTRLKARLVCTDALAQCARALSLGDMLRVGRGANCCDQVGHRETVLESCFEAVVGAVYLDGGFDAAYEMVSVLLGPVMQALVQRPDRLKDPKTLLQEKCLAKYHEVPEYRVVGGTGPSHRPKFTVEVALPDGSRYQGQGRSRRAAEMEAARQALAKWT